MINLRIITLTLLIILVSIGFTYAIEYMNGGISSDIEFVQQADSSVIKSDTLDKLVPYLDDLNKSTGFGNLILFIIAIVLATFVSEDLACIGAGLMVSNGMLTLWEASFAAVLGIFIGDYTVYLSGMILGKRVFHYPPFKWILNEENVEASVRWFKTKGPVLLVLSRFIPGSRFPVYLSAGLLRTKFTTFTIYFGASVIILTPLLVWISAFAGNEILSIYEKYDDYAVWILLALFIILYFVYKITLPLFTTQGRRRFWATVNSFLNKKED